MDDTTPPQPSRKFIATLVITFAGASGSVVIEDLGLIRTQHALILASLFSLAFVATILVAKRRNARNADGGHLDAKTVDRGMPLEPYQRRRLRILTPEPAVVYLLALGMAALGIRLYGVTPKAAIIVGVGVSVVLVWKMVYGLYLLSKKLKFEAGEGLYWES